MDEKRVVNAGLRATQEGHYVDSDAVYEEVQRYYGRVLQSSGDLKTSACCTVERPLPIIEAALKKIPSAITDRYYGCGIPVPLGIEGRTVLDLGSGSGRDCYLASALVGAHGTVIGVDITEELLQVARAHVEEYCSNALGYPSPNMRFLRGHMEFLERAGVANESVDICISNCVVNLSPNKRLVLESVWRALRVGGEFNFSDVYCDRRLPSTVRAHQLLLGECIAGALYEGDFRRLCSEIGFGWDPLQLARREIEINDPELRDVCGPARFYSVHYRLFKLPPNTIEMDCEDYGQVATYMGTIPGAKHVYVLDQVHSFETNRPVRVCGNTASILQETWLQLHFHVQGPRTQHFGKFGNGCSMARLASSTCSTCC